MRSRTLTPLRVLLALFLAVGQPWLAVYTCCPASEAVEPGGCAHARVMHEQHPGHGPAPETHHKGPCIHCSSAPSAVLASSARAAVALLPSPVVIAGRRCGTAALGPLLAHHLLPFATAPPTIAA